MPGPEPSETLGRTGRLWERRLGALGLFLWAAGVGAGIPASWSFWMLFLHLTRRFLNQTCGEDRGHGFQKLILYLPWRAGSWRGGGFCPLYLRRGRSRVSPVARVARMEKEEERRERGRAWTPEQEWGGSGQYAVSSLWDKGSGLQRTE